MGHPSAGAWVSYGLGTENRGSAGLHRAAERRRHGAARRRRASSAMATCPASIRRRILKADGDEALANIKPRESDDLQRQRLGFHQRNGRPLSPRRRRRRRSRRRSATTRPPTACRPRCRSCATSAAKARRRRSSTAWMPRTPNKAAYGRQCLVARRLIERGVRFVELSCLPQKLGAGQAANPWDQHGKLKEGPRRHGASGGSAASPR